MDMKKFLSLLLALTLALSIALPTATASAEDGVIINVNDDLAKAWAGATTDIEGWPSLTADKFFIAIFTHDQLSGSKYNTGDNSYIKIIVSSEYTGNIDAYLGQCGYTSVNHEWNEYINGIWTPIYNSELPQAQDSFLNNIEKPYQQVFYDLPTLVDAGSQSGDYLAVGFSLKNYSSINKDVDVTISLAYGDTTVASASHTFQASSGSPGEISTGDKIITIKEVHGAPFETGAVITQEREDLSNFAKLRLGATTSDSITDTSGLTWKSSNTEVASVEKSTTNLLEA